MIPYTDVAFVAFINSLFPGKNVIYADPETARQKLAATAQEAAEELTTDPNIPPDTENTIGLPGLAIFRTEEQDDIERLNMPLAVNGRSTNQRPVANQILFVKEIPVKLIYSVEVYAEHYTEINDITRTLRFCDKYKTIAVTFPTTVLGVKTSVPYKLFFKSAGPPKYDRVVNKKTGDIIWFQLSWQFIVESQWVISDTVPQANEIFVKFYNKVTSGKALPSDLIDQFKITTALPQ